MGIYSIPSEIIVDLTALRKISIGDTSADLVGFYGTTPAVQECPEATDVTSFSAALVAVGLWAAT